MVKNLWTLAILTIFALFAPGRVTVDGTTRGRSPLPGGLALNLGKRRLALAFVEFRPGRVYYRLAVGGA